MTYSALATTQEITSLPKVPVDVVFVLDLSASMNWGQHAEEAEGTNDEEACENSRIKAMVDALNASIEELVKDNPENRIGIAVFNGTAKTLMELTSAEKILEEGKDGEK